MTAKPSDEKPPKDAESEEEDVEELDEDDDEEAPKKSSKKFSQAQLNRFLSREKSEGKKSGKKEVLEALGVKDLEEAQSLLKRVRDKEAESQSEAERAAEKARKDAEEADKAKKEAKLERVEARIERQLMKAKVKEGKEGKVAKLLDIDRDEDPSADDIKDAIETLQEDFPELFTSEDEEGEEKEPKAPNRPSRRGDPGRPPRKQPQKDASGKARSRLEERHGRKLQKRESS